MKLLRYGPSGAERPGLLDDQGVVPDLSAFITDIDPTTVTPSVLARLVSLAVDGLPKMDGRPRIGVPIASVGKFVAIGLNFVDHAQKANLPIPKEPIVFMKTTSSLSGPDDDVMLPRGSECGDWRVELGIVIGSKASYVMKEAAINHVAGNCLVNDVSERAYQMDRGSTRTSNRGAPALSNPVGSSALMRRATNGRSIVAAAPRTPSNHLLTIARRTASELCF